MDGNDETKQQPWRQIVMMLRFVSEIRISSINGSAPSSSGTAQARNFSLK